MKKNTPEMETSWQIERAMTNLGVSEALWWPWISDIKKKDAAIAELVEGLRRAEEELRLIRMKDHGTVHDVMLRTDLTSLIAKYGDKT